MSSRYKSLLLVKGNETSEYSARAANYVVAYRLAEQGHRVLVLTKRLEAWEELKQQFAGSCEANAFTRLRSLYYSDYLDVIHWCRLLRHIDQMPTIVIFETFGDSCDYNPIEIYNVTVALLCAAVYSSTVRETPYSLQGLVVSTNDTHTTPFLNLFNRIFRVPTSFSP